MPLLPPASLSCFLPFSRLPVEIRLLIWKHFHNLTPVHVYKNIAYTPLEYQFEVAMRGREYPQLFMQQMEKIPLILHICKESRAEGFRHYSLGFNVSEVKNDFSPSMIPPKDAHTKMPQGVFWNKSKDTMFLNWFRPWSLQGPEADFILEMIELHRQGCPKSPTWGAVKFDILLKTDSRYFDLFFLGTKVLFIVLPETLSSRVIGVGNETNIKLAILRFFWRRLLKFGFDVDMVEIRVEVVCSSEEAVEVVETGMLPTDKRFSLEELDQNSVLEDEAAMELRHGIISDAIRQKLKLTMPEEIS